MIIIQDNFLSSMLERFPSHLYVWIQIQEKVVDELARLEANGDYEVNSSIYNSEISRAESYFDEEHLFNYSMLLMVFSNYESFLLSLAKEHEIEKSRPSNIATKFGVILDEEYLSISESLYDTLSPWRNQLCHNNGGTLFMKKDM